MKLHIAGNEHLGRITYEFFYPRHTMTSAAESDVIWVCHDTPIIDGRADVQWVVQQIIKAVPADYTGVVLVSSQLPVGQTRELESALPEFRFAVCPENFRYADGPEAYASQARFVVGTRSGADREALTPLFDFAQSVVWMSVESAEMVKHAMNAYLGMCIAFINEISDVCEQVGANIEDVERGLRSEPRVSMAAPLRHGGPFGLGHLDRDLTYLREIASLTLIPAIQDSNNKRK